MALVKYGGLAQDVRGSQNGLTYSRNKGGAYVRQKVSPVQPVSSFASLSRAIFAALAQRWAVTLTQSQREAWIAFAATHTFVNVFGDAITLSGIAMYMSVNRAVGQVGGAYIDDPPDTFAVPSVVSSTIVVALSGGVVSAMTQNTVVSEALTGDQGVYIFATPPLPPGVRPQRSDFRLINSPDSGLAAINSDLAAMYNERFVTPSLTPTRAIWFRLVILDPVTGCVGVGVTIQADMSGIGSVVPIESYVLTDNGGGNVIASVITSIPHGLTTAQTVDVVMDAPVTGLDGTGLAVVVTGPTTFTLPSRTGTATSIIVAPGTVTRVS